VFHFQEIIQLLLGNMNGYIQIDAEGNVTPEWNNIQFPVGSNPKDRASCQFSLTLNEKWNY
jgi:hypothetical protein